MTYELWDTESRNIVGDYQTEADALAVVRDVIDDDGPGAVTTLLLADEDARGKTTVIAASDKLIVRAAATGRESLDRDVVADEAASIGCPLNRCLWITETDGGARCVGQG